MTIGERVLQLIHESGMTQKEFSEQTGIPQSTISDWKGKRLNPASDKIMIICDVLDVDPAYLLSGTERPKNMKIPALTVYDDSEEYHILREYQDLNNDMRKRLLGYIEALKDLQK